MKKQILIIGYANGLKGVKSDLDNYYRFFRSPMGGGWYEDEICILPHTSSAQVMKYIDYFCRMRLDYFIFVFCGHGASMRDEVVMQVNNTDPFIREKDILNVAPRQLSIFDCCRERESDDSFASLTEMRLFSSGGQIRGNARQRYEQRIMQAVPQSACLYACSVGECADGNNSGGLYSYSLLKAARNIVGETDYKTVGRCHYEACQQLEAKNAAQHPDYKLPRCLVNRSLILSIHP